MKFLTFVIFFEFIIAWNYNLMASYVNLTTACRNNDNWYHHCTLTSLYSSLHDPLIIEKSNTTVFPELTEIILRNSNVPVMPSEMFELLPNLEILFMHRCGLKSIQVSDFITALKLRKLILQNNHLSELPENIFSKSIHLEEIRLTNNHILYVHDKAFDKLENLKELDLSVNNIHELCNDVFKSLSKLEIIDLSHNLIQKIDKETFLNNLNLQMIILNDNKFVTFESESLSHLSHLHLMDASFNKIEEIHLNSVNTLLIQDSELRRCVINGSVIRLRASNNMLESIMIADKKSVKEIEIHGNLFVSLNDFMGMKNLQKLDISKNQLKTLSTKESPTFLPLANLNQLNLANNEIQILTPEIFLLLTKLTHLDIAFNRIIYFNEWIFEPLHSLEKLYLEGNQLHKFDFENFTKLHPFIREMGIFSNDWEFSYLQKMTTHLKMKGIHLPVRYNPKESIHFNSSQSSITTSFHHHTAEYMDVPTTHESYNETTSDWTKRDILIVAILCFILFILLFQFYKICKEQSCFLNFQRTFQSRNNPIRLSEEDSQV